MKLNNTAKTKPTKKKILTYYLVLAACLLVIAGITVGIVFAVRANSVVAPPSIEAPDGDKNPDDGKEPDDGDEEQPDKPTNSQYEFIVPV